MINITKPYIGLRECANALNVLVSGNLAAGKYVKQLENEFSRKFCIPHVSAVSNGTTALQLALLAAGVGQNDEVITTSFTFIATANAIQMVGATPVLIDIDADTLCISPSRIKDFVTNKTKALIAVNLYGMPCDFDEIRNSLPKNVVIIEDAAQSVGAVYKDKCSGNLGDIATFSLYATKNITSGEGGLVATNNNSIAQKVNILRQHGMAQNGSYEYETLGYNYRMSDLQASVAVAQLKKFDEIRRKRYVIYQRYYEGLSGGHGLEMVLIPPHIKSSHHQLPIRIKAQAKLSRDGLKQKLLELGIKTAIYYPAPLYNIKHLRDASKYLECPNAEAAAKELLCLPIHPGLAEDDQWYIIDCINQLLR